MNIYKWKIFKLFWIKVIKVGFINQYGLYIQNFISFGPKFIFLTKFICQWLIKVQDKNIGIYPLITKSIHTSTSHINKQSKSSIKVQAPSSQVMQHNLREVVFLW